jgi:hypothetical protein
MVNSVAMQCNNRAAVFSMRSVPTTIVKLFILYKPMVNNVAKLRMDKHATMDSQCNSRGILGRVFFMVRSQAI